MAQVISKTQLDATVPYCISRHRRYDCAPQELAEIQFTLRFQKNKGPGQAVLLRRRQQTGGLDQAAPGGMQALSDVSEQLVQGLYIPPPPARHYVTGGWRQRQL